MFVKEKPERKKNVYRSVIITRNLPCPEKFLVACLQRQLEQANNSIRTKRIFSVSGGLLYSNFFQKFLDLSLLFELPPR